MELVEVRSLVFNLVVLLYILWHGQPFSGTLGDIRDELALSVPAW